MKNMSISQSAKLTDETALLIFRALELDGFTNDEKKYVALLWKGREERNFKTVEPIISTDDWRSQGNSKGKGFYPDNEGHGTACKTVSEKMVYRHLYDDLKSDFKIAEVIYDKTGKYKYIVGNTGIGEYLSLLNEDKAQFKKIETKHCTNCGFKIPVSVNFCDNCGTKLV